MKERKRKKVCSDKAIAIHKEGMSVLDDGLYCPEMQYFFQGICNGGKSSKNGTLEIDIKNNMFFLNGALYSVEINKGFVPL